MAERQGAVDLVRSFRTMCALSWQADRARSVIALVSTVAVPLTRSMQAVGFGLVADGVIAGDRGQATAGGLLVGGLLAASRIADWASVTVRMRLREHTIVLIDERVMEYVAGTPGLEHHERPEHQDRLSLMRAERWALNNPFMPVAWSVGNLMQVVATMVVLGALHPLMLLLPLAAVPSLVLGLRIERLKEGVRTEHAEPRRAMSLLFELATTAPAAKEMRVFDLGDEIEDRHRRLFTGIDAKERRVDRRAGWLGAAGWGCFGAGFMATVAFAVSEALAGRLSVGAVVVTLSLGTQVNGQVMELVENARWFSRTTAAIGRYRWLADYSAAARATLTPEVTATVAAPERLATGIRFEGVGFTYPGTATPVLEGLDLHVPAGSTLAIVGENGAGKTTLVKLLLRFYEPTTGTITVDGVDLRRIPVDDWRTRVSAGFQDFARLQLLARESVGVGALARLDDTGAVAAALERAAAGDLANLLPAGLETQLGREQDGGVDLSTGQWQKVALGRTMMREQPLVLLLDEPTASLDSATEHALFERFATQAREAARRCGAVTVLVSHRFSTVRMADHIVVVDGGRVVEAGTHDVLMGAGGRYAELYLLQAAGYR